MTTGPDTPGAAADVAVETSASFETFVAARGDALWRSAWLLTGDAGRAEDLVQTALAKAWPHWSRVTGRDGPAGFEAYVRRALVTTYASWWRRRWTGEHPSDDVPDVVASDPSADTAVRRDLMTALTALPRGQRAVVVLRFVEDRTERETADLLGASVGTVKSQAARGLAALRRSPALANETHPSRTEHD